MKTVSVTQGLGARALAAIALFSLVAGLVPMQAFANHDTGAPYQGLVLGKNSDRPLATIDKIRICHSTSSQTNQYTNPDVNISSFFSSGHDKDLNDIIPPFHYTLNGTTVLQFNGTNWNTAGQATWNNGCVAPVAPKSINLSVTKVANDDTPDIGQTVIYTITVSNNGPDAATNVIVTDNVPAGTTFVSATPAQTGTGPYTWNLGSITANTSKTVTVNVTVNTGTGGNTITNTASVVATETDSNTGNNTVTEDVTINTPAPTLCTDPAANNQGQPLPCTFPPTPCPDGFTGTEPNCVAIPCPEGYTGAQPNCVPPVIPCDAPFTGTQPNCVLPPCPDGYSGTVPNCVPPPCPDGQIGEVPNCVLPPCPEGWTGTAPNCVPPVIPCDAPFTGTQPNCVLPPCPEGFTGVFPVCFPPIIIPCPEGTFGTFPICLPPPPQLCLDDSANNFGQALPCTYGGGDPDPVRCTNPTAQNYGEEAACVFFTSQCVQTPNLLVNASFEDPVVNAGNGIGFGVGFYGIFALITGWSATNGIEIWNNILSGSSDLAQSTELDANSNDVGPSTLSQPVTTIPGATYELSFDFAARTDTTSATDNSVVATVDAATISESTNNTTFVTYGTTFVADDATATVSFTDAGTDNSLGTVIDNAVLCLVREPAPVDYCPNIQGNQTEDDGYTKDVNGQCYTPIDSCEVTVVSDATNLEGGSAALLVTPHPVWVASIIDSVAKWIWGSASDSPIDPVIDETQTFTKTFVWSGAPGTAILTLAADNGYSVKLNGTTVGGDAGEFNYSSTDTIVDLTDNVIQGVNTLEIAVTNEANGATSLNIQDGNPAGLLYDLTITNTTGDCAPDDGDGDGEGDNDDLSCTITADNNTIRRGRDVNITWDSTNAVSAMLNGESVALDGTQLFENLREDTTYTLTIMDENEQTDSCTVSVDTRSGGGGGGNSAGDRDDDQDGEVLGDSDDLDDAPAGEVLGDQVSAVPVGAPNAGQGGTSPFAQTPFGIVPVAFVRRSRHG